MLLLPSTDVNFQALAENIVSDFFGKGISLEDGVVKTAQEQKFTPEEIKRLVEKTNTAASLHLLKTAEDRKATFTLAQMELVLRRTHPSKEEQQEKTASIYAGLPTTRQTKSLPDLFFVPHEMAKVASEPKTFTDLQAYQKLRQELETRQIEKTALEDALHYEINKLADKFNTEVGLDDFVKYAAECQQVWGVAVDPVLTEIANYLHLRWPLEKNAYVDAFVDDRKPDLQTMRVICQGLGALQKLATELVELQAASDYYWQSAKRGARS